VRTLKQNASILLVALAAGLAPAPARAQNADEYVLILLDRSASMGDAAVSGAASPAFWDNAIAAAQSQVHRDQTTLKGDARPARAYAVWTFLDDTCSRCPRNVCDCANTQKNVKQIWPPMSAEGKGAPSECTAASGGALEPTSGMCVFASGKAGDKMYELLKHKILPALGKQRPSPQANTPLAESLCLAVEKLQAVAQDRPKTIILETDAGESSSTSACSGFGSVALAGDNFAKKEGWGLTAGSWQDMFLRRTIRIGRFPPRADDPAKSDAQARAAVRFGRGILLPGEKLPSTLHLRTDLHYAICDPATPTSSPCTEPDRSADPPFRELYAKTGPSRPSVHPGEMSFFKALTKGLANSALREFARVPAASLGVKHKIAGDVDDSGCVDDTDLYFVTNKEVWLSRAVPPAADAVRADLNRDGWVNQKDATILLATWGKGCKPSPGKKPPLPE
jgi:hypothetical protein